MPLSNEDLSALLVVELDRVERKQSASSSSMERIREAVCAFANDLPDHRLPGIVFVGIKDDGTCANLSIGDELLKTLAAIRDDGAITPFPIMEVRRVTLDNCTFAAVIVEPSGNPPIRFRGRTWIRVGPRRAIATPEEEKRLIEKRRWGNLPFDAQPVYGSALGDLDLKRFKLEYLPSLISPDTIAQNQRSDEQQLRALRLVDTNNTPTTTAILMLGKSPQDFFPGATIAWRLVGGLKLTDDTIDERTLTGSIPDQLRIIDELMDVAIPNSVSMGVTTHRRMTSYPKAALQQLVRNAVMHRDYSAANTPVRVTVYIDRIEIISPGGLFGVVTPETFGKPGFTDYRNPTLAEALKGYGFVERFGQGIEIVRETLAQNGNSPAEFRFEPPEAPSWVHVTVRIAPVTRPPQ